MKSKYFKDASAKYFDEKVILPSKKENIEDFDLSKKVPKLYTKTDVEEEIIEYEIKD